VARRKLILGLLLSIQARLRSTCVTAWVYARWMHQLKEKRKEFYRSAALKEAPVDFVISIRKDGTIFAFDIQVSNFPKHDYTILILDSNYSQEYISNSINIVTHRTTSLITVKERYKFWMSLARNSVKLYSTLLRSSSSPISLIIIVLWNFKFLYQSQGFPQPPFKRISKPLKDFNSHLS